MIGSKDTDVLMTFWGILFILYVNVLLLPVTKFESQIDCLPKDSLGKSNNRTLFSEIAFLPQECSKVAVWKNVNLSNLNYKVYIDFTEICFLCEISST